MANEEHMQRVEAHYRALGMKNPHASHFAAMRGGSGGGAKARSGGLGSGKVHLGTKILLRLIEDLLILIKALVTLMR